MLTLSIVFVQVSGDGGDEFMVKYLLIDDERNCLCITVQNASAGCALLNLGEKEHRREDRRVITLPVLLLKNCWDTCKAMFDSPTVAVEGDVAENGAAFCGYRNHIRGTTMLKHTLI